MSRAGHAWWVGPVALAGAVLLRGLARTWRVDQKDDADYLAAVQAGEPVILCFWHARMLPLAYTHRDEGVAVLVSQHRDGELISRLLAALGSTTARGSSTRGGEAAVRALLRHARTGLGIAITPDGPRGPAEEFKDGAVYLASRLKRRIVPVATAAHPSWAARSWDRFRVPRPFARVCISHGAPLSVPSGLDESATRAVQAELQRRLRDLTAAVCERAGDVS